jgi:hypothetical protein
LSDFIIGLPTISKIFEGGRQRRGINPKRDDRVPFRDRPLDLTAHLPNRPSALRPRRSGNRRPKRLKCRLRGFSHPLIPRHLRSLSRLGQCHPCRGWRQEKARFRLAKQGGTGLTGTKRRLESLRQKISTSDERDRCERTTTPHARRPLPSCQLRRGLLLRGRYPLLSIGFARAVTGTQTKCR